MIILAAVILFSLAMAIFVGFCSALVMFISGKLLFKKHGFSKQLIGKNFIINISEQLKKPIFDFDKKRQNRKTYVQIDFIPK